MRVLTYFGHKTLTMCKGKGGKTPHCRYLEGLSRGHRESEELLDHYIKQAIKHISHRDSEEEEFDMASCHRDVTKNPIEFRQRELIIARENGDKDLEGEAYVNLGNAYRHLGDFKQAIEFYQQGLSIAKEIENKDLEGSLYENLGNAYRCLGDVKHSIDFYQQGLSVAKEIGNRDLEGTAYCSIGDTYRRLGNSKKAIEFHEQGFAIAKEIGNKESEASTYGNLGNAYHALGDFKQAVKFHQYGLNIAEEIDNKDLQGTIYCSLGNAYRCRCDFKKAIEFYQLSLNIAKQIGNEDLEGTVYDNLGNAYRFLDDYKKAVEFHQQGLIIATKTGNKDSEASAYGNLGNEYSCLGDFKKAIEFHRQSLRIAKEIGNKELQGNAYNNLGKEYCSLGDLEKAIEFFQRGLDIAKEIGDKDSEGRAYSNLGDAYRALGDFNGAIESHQQGLSIAKEIANEDSKGSLYAKLGTDYHSCGDYKKAMEFHQKGLRIAKKTGNKDSEEVANRSLGVACYCLGDFARAEKFFKSSIKLFEEIRFLLQDKDEWKISFRNRYKVYSLLWSHLLRQGRGIQALFAAEQGRAQALTDLMESQYGIKSSRSSSEKQMKRTSNILKQISSPTLFLAEALESVNFWVLLDGQRWHFARKEINFTLDCLTSETYKVIGVYRSAMCENRSMDESADETISHGGMDVRPVTPSQGEANALKTLYDVVISPVSHLIKGDELVIVPDGPAFLIPYAALVDQNSSYLSETLRIRLAPSLTSLRLLAECSSERHSTSGALLVGNPWVETVRVKGKKIKQLPGAEDEVKMIGQILHIEPLTGKNASKDEVLSRLNSVSLVHIASHGRAETGEILLSPNLGSCQRPKEKDFLLTMADVLNAKLNAKLVVLSCCHSGRGKIQAEGVFGIARAFLGAGARSVIASLWAINDAATLEFMRHLYESLMTGQSASNSLHQAMKWMRESEKFCAVKDWASFVLIGDDVSLNFDE